MKTKKCLICQKDLLQNKIDSTIWGCPIIDSGGNLLEINDEYHEFEIETMIDGQIKNLSCIPKSWFYEPIKYCGSWIYFARKTISLNYEEKTSVIKLYYKLMKFDRQIVIPRILDLDFPSLNRLLEAVDKYIIFS